MGNREDSNVYIRMKLRGAAEIGMYTRLIKLESSITQNKLIQTIQQLNNNDNVHGIILQLPLDSGLNFLTIPAIFMIFLGIYSLWPINYGDIFHNP